MMRLLFTCVAGSQQHLNCLLPLLSAAVEQGHEVALASGPDRADAARRLGVGFFPIGESFEALIRRARHEMPVYRVGGQDEEAITYGGFFAGLAGPRSAADLLHVLHDFRPDVVIHETAEFGAPLAATLRQVPYATHAWGLPIPVTLLEAAGAALAETWRRSGLSPHRYGGMYEHLAVDVFPASLRIAQPLATALRRQDVRYSWARGPRQGALPAWVGDLGSRPTVHVSFGTAAFNRDTALLRSIVDALADEDVTVVVVVGPGNDPAELGTLPSNTVAGDMVPHDLLMPHCQAVVTHGGSGTTLSALAHGVPLLVIPQGADQFRTAAAVEKAAAGLSILGEVTGEAIHRGVRLLLSHPLPAFGAARVAEEIAAMPSPQEALAGIAAALLTGAS